MNNFSIIHYAKIKIQRASCMILSKKELRFYIAADRRIANKPFKISWKKHLLNILRPDYISMYLRSMRHVVYCEKLLIVGI